MVPPLEESEDGNRASFPRWGKRSVISSHFTELVLKIKEMRMLTFTFGLIDTLLGVWYVFSTFLGKRFL